MAKISLKIIQYSSINQVKTKTKENMFKIENLKFQNRVTK
jgi:hypothetical protein